RSRVRSATDTSRSDQRLGHGAAVGGPRHGRGRPVDQGQVRRDGSAAPRPASIRTHPPAGSSVKVSTVGPATKSSYPSARYSAAGPWVNEALAGSVTTSSQERSGAGTA